MVNCSSQQFDCGPDAVPRCISQAWVCDGQVDCENGLDELSSNASQCGMPTSQVRSRIQTHDFIELQQCNKETHFHCLNHSKCIKIQFLCDGFLDCPDGSDEGVFCSTLQSCT